MNIIYFHVHDQGRYIQPYGYPVSTPNLQRFAEEGVLFRNAFCTTPSCSPSRAALLTGQYPHQNGMFGLTNEGWLLNDYSKHLRKTLSDHGFETVLAGTHHVTPHTQEGVQRLGYDRVLIEEDEADLAEVRTSAAINYLREEHDKPFFLALGYDITHRSKWERSFVHSYARYGDLDARYTRPVPGLPDTPELREEAERLRTTLDEWMKRTGDPAVNDTIPEQPERPQRAIERASKKDDWGTTWIKWYEALNTR